MHHTNMFRLSWAEVFPRQAIFTGSAVVVDGAGPDGKGPGVVTCTRDECAVYVTEMCVCV